MQIFLPVPPCKKDPILGPRGIRGRGPTTKTCRAFGRYDPHAPVAFTLDVSSLPERRIPDAARRQEWCDGKNVRLHPLGGDGSLDGVDMRVPATPSHR